MYSLSDASYLLSMGESFQERWKGSHVLNIYRLFVRLTLVFLHPSV